MKHKPILLANNTDIKALSYSVRDFYLDRGYSVEIHYDGSRKTVVDASRKKRRLHSVLFSHKGGAVEVVSHNYYVINNMLIFGSLTVIQACLGRMIGGMIGADSLCYAIGLLLGITETLFWFVPGMREARTLQEVIREEARPLMIAVAPEESKRPRGLKKLFARTEAKRRNKTQDAAGGGSAGWFRKKFGKSSESRETAGGRS
jgi:hypothetical protein